MEEQQQQQEQQCQTGARFLWPLHGQQCWTKSCWRLAKWLTCQPVRLAGQHLHETPSSIVGSTSLEVACCIIHHQPTAHPQAGAAAELTASAHPAVTLAAAAAGVVDALRLCYHQPGLALRPWHHHVCRWLWSRGAPLAGLLFVAVRVVAAWGGLVASSGCC